MDAIDSLTFFEHILGMALMSALIAFILAPIVAHFLYHFRIIKRPKIELIGVGDHDTKANTPIMGGLIVIITVAVITFFANWSRSYTWVPIGVMGLSALLGGIDDILNVFGHQRRVRSLRHVLVLARVHQSALARLWYWFTIPFVAARSVVARFGSYSSRGVHVHEKLLLQFAAGAIAAWWIYTKLGDAWHVLDVPFVGDVTIGWLTIPLVILVVMFTANAVNIADGMDGLAGGMLIPTFGALTLMSWLSSFNELALLNATVMGALISYTYFNIKPARFHMGDVGSLGLGALLAINAMAIGQTVSLILLGGLFYIEALSVIIQVIGRRIFGRRIFKMAPLHHHFEMIGWSEEKTIMRFWLVHFAMVLAGMWLWLVS